MSQDALGQLKHLKTARARWPFPDEERENRAASGMRAALFIQWDCGGGERTKERGRIPPLLISLLILLPVSLRASPCNPCVPPPTPPHSLLSSPRQLLTALVCQCGWALIHRRRAVVLKVGGVGVRVGCCWFWGFHGVRDIKGGCAVVFDAVWGVKGGWGAVFDGVRGIKGGWRADLGVVGLFVIGSGVLSAFAGWRVAVCRFRASVC